jgi:hypothetical protein
VLAYVDVYGDPTYPIIYLHKYVNIGGWVGAYLCSYLLSSTYKTKYWIKFILKKINY